MTADPTGPIAPPAGPRVTLVHDYLTQRGGAERVVVQLLHAFPGAPLHTSLYDPAATFPELAGADVRSSVLDRVHVLRRHHRAALPALAPVFSRMRLAPADVVIASSSGWAHGVHAEVPVVVYCHNPARWLYQRSDYLGDRQRATGAVLGTLRRPLVSWDRRAAARATRYVCQSTVVRDRIRAAYGIDAEPVPAPPGIDPSGPHRHPPSAPEPGFLLCISRLLPYKHVDAVIAAFGLLPGQRLVVVGDGPERDRLRAAAGAGVHLAGTVDDDVLRWYLANCAGVVAASHEDYGLTPLEGLAFGRPSAVLRAGGFLDTVVEHDTGVFFDAPEPAAIAAAIRTLVDTVWRQHRLAAQLEQFSPARFDARMREIVREVAR